VIKKFINVFFYRTKLFCIGITNTNILDFVKNKKQDDVKWMKYSSGFIADPFFYSKDNKIYIFFEEYIEKKKKGVISIVEFLDNNFINKSIIIEENSHLSYPTLIEYDSNLYCIPEQSNGNGLFLYKSLEFPNKWEKRLLLTGKFSDSEFLFYNNKWWMFCTFETGNYFETNSKLYIYHSDCLESDWTPHINNPVKVDISSARSGGKIFFNNGEIFRPAQDCSEDYGKNLVINKIIKLNEFEFEEVKNTIINPQKSSKYKDGIHHITGNNIYTVIDGYKYKYRLRTINMIFNNIHNIIKNKLKGTKVTKE